VLITILRNNLANQKMVIHLHNNYYTMNKTKRDNTGLIVVRPQAKNKFLKKKLQELAEKSTCPSLNNYLEIHLLKLVKK
jgi:hypothetical protein